MIYLDCVNALKGSSSELFRLESLDYLNNITLSQKGLKQCLLYFRKVFIFRSIINVAVECFLMNSREPSLIAFAVQLNEIMFFVDASLTNFLTIDNQTYHTYSIINLLNKTSLHRKVIEWIFDMLIQNHHDSFTQNSNIELWVESSFEWDNFRNLLSEYYWLNFSYGWELLLSLTDTLNSSSLASHGLNKSSPLNFFHISSANGLRRDLKKYNNFNQDYFHFTLLFLLCQEVSKPLLLNLFYTTNMLGKYSQNSKFQSFETLLSINQENIWPNKFPGVSTMNNVLECMISTFFLQMNTEIMLMSTNSKSFAPLDISYRVNKEQLKDSFLQQSIFPIEFNHSTLHSLNISYETTSGDKIRDYRNEILTELSQLLLEDQTHKSVNKDQINQANKESFNIATKTQEDRKKFTSSEKKNLQDVQMSILKTSEAILESKKDTLEPESNDSNPDEIRIITTPLNVIRSVSTQLVEEAKEMMQVKYTELIKEVEKKKSKAIWQIKRLKKLSKSRQNIKILYSDSKHQAFLDILDTSFDVSIRNDEENINTMISQENEGIPHAILPLPSDITSSKESFPIHQDIKPKFVTKSTYSLPPIVPPIVSSNILGNEEIKIEIPNFDHSIEISEINNNPKAIPSKIENNSLEDPSNLLLISNEKKEHDSINQSSDIKPASKEEDLTFSTKPSDFLQSGQGLLTCIDYRLLEAEEHIYQLRSSLELSLILRGTKLDLFYVDQEKINEYYRDFNSGSKFNLSEFLLSLPWKQRLSPMHMITDIQSSYLKSYVLGHKHTLSLYQIYLFLNRYHILYHLHNIQQYFLLSSNQCYLLEICESMTKIYFDGLILPIIEPPSYWTNSHLRQALTQIQSNRPQFLFSDKKFRSLKENSLKKSFVMIQKTNSEKTEKNNFYSDLSSAQFSFKNEYKNYVNLQSTMKLSASKSSIQEELICSCWFPLLNNLPLESLEISYLPPSADNESLLILANIFSQDFMEGIRQFTISSLQLNQLYTLYHQILWFQFKTMSKTKSRSNNSTSFEYKQFINITTMYHKLTHFIRAFRQFFHDSYSLITRKFHDYLADQFSQIAFNPQNISMENIFQSIKSYSKTLKRLNILPSLFSAESNRKLEPVSQETSDPEINYQARIRIAKALESSINSCRFSTIILLEYAIQGNTSHLNHLVYFWTDIQQNVLLVKHLIAQLDDKEYQNLIQNLLLYLEPLLSGYQP